MKATVIGGGLSGCEAAYLLAEKGVEVILYEMRPVKHTPAHKTDKLGELVCSNSLKAKRVESAGGMLKAEMRLLGSLVLDAADHAEVPAGGALAVDRNVFSDYITEKIKNHPNITVVNEEITEIPVCPAIIATGPLTSEELAKSIASATGDSQLYFYDAAAPVVSADSIDFNKVFAAARYGRGDDDYLNCPFTEEEYEKFYCELISAEKAELHSFEKETFRVYEGCMPIEVLASRGKDTMRFGPLKPVGLKDPKTDKRPYAVVQLRSENKEKTAFNLVGFQTNLKFPEQKRVFSMIPGLENAEFLRYGVMHRNTFLNAPRVLDKFGRLHGRDDLFFAGQMTGVEGYMESAAVGIAAGINLYRVLNGKEPVSFPKETMIGALYAHLSNDFTADFQPMGANMGILPPADMKIRDKKERYLSVATRGIDRMKEFIKEKEI